jgi:hypothetical protein
VRWVLYTSPELIARPVPSPLAAGGIRY